MTASSRCLTALGPLSTDMYLPSLPAIAARSRRERRRDAAHPLGLSFRLRGRAVRLRPGLRQGRPHARCCCSASRSSLPRALACAVRALDRGPDRRPLRPGARRLGADRARPRDRARPLRGAAGRPRIVPHGHDHGARPGRRADPRRRPARGRSAGARPSRRRSCSASALGRGGARRPAGDASARSRADRCRSRRSCAASARCCGTAAYRVYVALVGARLWRALRLHLRLVLRAAGRLRPARDAFALSFAFMRLRLHPPARSSRSGVVGRRGLDGTIALGVICLAAGGARHARARALGRAVVLRGHGCRWRSMRRASA